MNRFLPGIWLLLFQLAFQMNALGQEVVKIERINESIVFDGIPDEAVWSSLNNFQLTMHRPDYGSAPSEKSDVRIGYDNQFLWIGAKLYVSDVSTIFSPTRKRDDVLFDYDAFGIVLDTYNDNENALAFFTTPTGLRTDYAISRDAQGNSGPEGGSEINFSWNTFWDVKTLRDDKGWYVEMRIPFSSLKFKPENDIVTMGIIISRNISRNNETDTYPVIDPRHGFMAPNKPSLAGSIEFSGARPSKPVYVSPYIIGGLSRDWYLNDPETEYIKKDRPDYNAGLDIKYNLNSNLTLDLTANTDFAQVEADDQQVNLSRYSLFFPEKRMFFQERSSLFEFGLGDHSDNLFYSRNIGILNGEQIRILGGARLTGRLQKWDMGFLDMQTDANGEIPGENFGVLRIRRQVINENSYAGGIFTSRISMKGDRNLAYGLDGIFRLFGDDYLNVKWAQTDDSNIDSKLTSLDPSFFLINWQRRSEKGFAYDFKYFYSGQKFNPGSGYIRIGGIQGMGARLMYGWIPGGESRFFNYILSIGGDRFTRISDGNLEAMRISPEFELETKKGYRISIGTEFMKEGVLFDFPLSDSIWIKTGEYAFNAFQLRFSTPDSRLITIEADIEHGSFYDGKKTGVESGINFNLSSSLKIGTSYEFQAIRFTDRPANTSLDIHAINMKALYMFSTKLSASLLLQYMNIEDEMIANFRFRYNPREGNDFFLVYNDFRSLNMRNDILQPPPYFNRTIMIKYTHTFIF